MSRRKSCYFKLVDFVAVPSTVYKLWMYSVNGTSQPVAKPDILTPLSLSPLSSTLNHASTPVIPPHKGLILTHKYTADSLIITLLLSYPITLCLNCFVTPFGSPFSIPACVWFIFQSTAKDVFYNLYVTIIFPYLKILMAFHLSLKCNLDFISWWG